MTINTFYVGIERQVHNLLTEPQILFAVSVQLCGTAARPLTGSEIGLDGGTEPVNPLQSN